MILAAVVAVRGLEWREERKRVSSREGRGERQGGVGGHLNFMSRKQGEGKVKRNGEQELENATCEEDVDESQSDPRKSKKSRSHACDETCAAEERRRENKKNKGQETWQGTTEEESVRKVSGGGDESERAPEIKVKR